MTELEGMRVLLVEDEVMIALMAQDMLADLGATVIGPAGTIAQGLALARHSALDFDGTARRIEDAAELHQEAVAHHLEDAPGMFDHGRIEELAAVLAKRPQGALLIGLHQPAVANDVGRQNGC